VRHDQSECAPLEASLDGDRLKWKSHCKGQLDMVVIGDYKFRDRINMPASCGPRRRMAASR